MNERIARVLIGPDATMRQAMETVDRGAIEICLVVGDDGRLLGTVTDGDLRRAILMSVPLDVPIAQVMHRQFTAVGPEASNAEVLDLMKRKTVKAIPVLDHSGRLLDLVLLREMVSLPNRPNVAVLMAGGLGRRLRPITDEIPKALVPVGDRPVMELLVNRLAHHGFRNILVMVHYKADQIRAHFGDGLAFGVRMHYLQEEEPSGTAGALRLAAEHLKCTFLVANCDLLTGVNFSSMLEFHQTRGDLLSMAVKQSSFQVQYGVVRTQEHDVLSIEEKPVHDFFINAGIYVMEPRALELFPPAGRFDMTDLVSRALAAGERVGAFPLAEYWIDIGQPKDLESAAEQYLKLQTR